MTSKTFFWTSASYTGKCFPKVSFDLTQLFSFPGNFKFHNFDILCSSPAKRVCILMKLYLNRLLKVQSEIVITYIYASVSSNYIILNIQNKRFWSVHSETFILQDSFVRTGQLSSYVQPLKDNHKKYLPMAFTRL